MLEQLPERFRQDKPELPAQAEGISPKIVDTLLISCNEQQDINGIREGLTTDSRDTALAAGILNSSGLAENIAVIIKNDSSMETAHEYLTRLDVKTENITFIEKQKNKTDAQVLSDISNNETLGEIATITIGNIDQDTEKHLNSVGIKLVALSPEEEIGERITEAIKMSRKQAVEVLKTIFLNMIRFKNIPNIQITKLVPNTA